MIWTVVESEWLYPILLWQRFLVAIKEIKKGELLGLLFATINGVTHFGHLAITYGGELLYPQIFS